MDDKEFAQLLTDVNNLSKEDKEKLLIEVNKVKESGEDVILMDMFCGNKIAKQVNKMMHAVNVFEPGKQLALYEKVEITGNANREHLCENMKNAWEKIGGYVLFVAISHINGVRTRQYPYYLKEGIQTLSMVQNNDLGWILFKRALEGLGYEVETDQHMHVLSVK